MVVEIHPEKDVSSLSAAVSWVMPVRSKYVICELRFNGINCFAVILLPTARNYQVLELTSEKKRPAARLPFLYLVSLLLISCDFFKDIMWMESRTSAHVIVCLLLCCTPLVRVIWYNVLWCNTIKVYFQGGSKFHIIFNNCAIYVN